MPELNRVFISDCEGPISKNDNAFEITSQFIPKGDRLFKVISRYDDIQAEIIKKPNYKAGSTLKMIIPFLKAFDVTDDKMHDFSTQTLKLIPHVKETIESIRKIAKVFIISTSYEHYIKAVCSALDFPYENSFYTKVRFDKYNLLKEEKTKLRILTEEISKMPLIKIPSKACTITDFQKEDKRKIKRLNDIFSNEIANLQSGRILDEVKPIGGTEKAKAIENVIQKTGIALSDVLYVGDSITDVDAFKLVRNNDGLTVSFNGNQYSVENAEVALLSKDSLPISIIAETFCRFGKKDTIKLINNWNVEALRKSPLDQVLVDKLVKLEQKILPQVEVVTGENMEILKEKSSKFRRKVRGEHIGRLG